MKLYKFIPAAALLLMASCSEDEMDRINTDHGNPPIDVINGRLMITDAITSTGFTTASGDYSYYASVYNEQIFGTGNNQFKNAELRQISEVAGSSTFNNVWNGTYATLLNLKSIIAKCGEGGLNSGQKDLLGMAQVLAALNWGILTDMHGDIPCSEALQGGALKQPKLDTQESIYKYIFALLDDAIANLTEAKTKGMSNVGDQDLLYGNDNSKWLAAAHAVKARYKLHMMKRDANAAAEALTEAQAAIDAGFDGMVLDIYDGTESLMSPWQAFQYSRDYCACTTTVQSLLKDRQDPRENVYIYYYSAGDEMDPADPDYQAPVCGIPGDETMAVLSGAWSLSAPKWLTYNAAGDYPLYPTATTHILSLSEVYFIMAEIQARNGADCTEALSSAINANFNDIKTFGSISQSASEYVASLSSRISDNPVKEVMVQKYLSQCRDEQVETYNDLRRCKALGEEFITLTNPKNMNGSSSRWPLRLPYGNSGVSSNPNVREAYGDGLYVFSEPVWIFGGTR